MSVIDHGVLWSELENYVHETSPFISLLHQSTTLPCHYSEGISSLVQQATKRPLANVAFEVSS